MSKLNDSMLGDRMFPKGEQVNVSWRYLEKWITGELGYGLDLDPPFQRAHVWSDSQRAAYVEHVLLGGEASRVLVVAFVGRSNTDIDEAGKLRSYALVDGKQRLEAVRRYMRDEVRIFAGVGGRAEGYVFSDTDDSLRRWFLHDFLVRTIVLPTAADILRLYVKLNAGGTPHTPEEIEKVRRMLEAEGAST